MCSISFGDFITGLTGANIDTTTILTEIEQLDDTFSEIVIIEFYEQISETADVGALKTAVGTLLSSYNPQTLIDIGGEIDVFQ